MEKIIWKKANLKLQYDVEHNFISFSPPFYREDIEVAIKSLEKLIERLKEEADNLEEMEDLRGRSSILFSCRIE